MLPSNFSVNYETLLQLVLYISILSIFIELILLVVFEHRWIIRRDFLRGKKEIIAFLLSLFVCNKLEFDAFAILNKSEVTSWGLFLTALILAGGTKGSMKLIQDVLKIKRSPEDIQRIMSGK